MEKSSTTSLKTNQNTSAESVNSFRHIFAILNLVSSLVFLDFVSKYAAFQLLNKPFQLFPGFQLQLEKNTGIAFSIAIPQAILIPLNLVIFLSLIIFLYKKTNLNKNLSLIIISLMAAGAIGNLFDRLYHGFVIDFISIGSFPVFNFADTFITLSVFLLLLFYDKIKRSN